MLEEYIRQQSFRDWEALLARIPPGGDGLALELGSGTGFVCDLLSRRFKNVVGIDANETLLHYARSRYPRCRFVLSDFESFDYEQPGGIDLVFSSFSWAYVREPVRLLERLRDRLAPRGRILIVEIDRMFTRHLPASDLFYERVFDFESRSAYSGRYSFVRGSELRAHFEAAGLTVELHDDNVRDPELNFAGPAGADVLRNWAMRLERLGPLKELLGEEYPRFCERFLSELASPAHACAGAVKLVVGRI